MVTAVVAWACGMERLGAVKLAGIVIGVVAAGYRIFVQEDVDQVAPGSDSQQALVGVVILAFLLCAAFYALLNKQINTKYNGATITAWGFCSATALFALSAGGYFVFLFFTVERDSATDVASAKLVEELQRWWPLHWTTHELYTLQATTAAKHLKTKPHKIVVTCTCALRFPRVSHMGRKLSFHMAL